MEETILSWFQQIAYNPALVYISITCFMVASSFGFPVPEEVTLVGAGFLAYMAMNPEIYPPPEPGAVGVNIHIIAAISLFSVILSDFLIYWLGRRFGPRFLRIRMVRRAIHPARMKKVTRWVHRYGTFAPAIFRFTPGLRFPGHFSCGMLGISRTRFLAFDGSAALLSVPTQIYLVGFKGREILEVFRRFQFTFMTIFGILVFIFIVRKLVLFRQRVRKSS